MKKQNYLYIFMVFLFITCSDDHNTIDQEVVQIEGTSMTNQILALVNKHRTNKGLNELKRNTTADNLSEDHNKYMIKNDVVNHDNFDDRASSLKKKEQAKGIGENVAWGYKDANGVVNAWLESAGHRANIEGDFTHTGLSALKDGGGTYYFTQLFFKQ